MTKPLTNNSIQPTMKKTIRKIAPLALVLLGLATLSFTANDGITLRLRPNKGKTYTVNSKQTSMSIMEVQGQTMNSTQSIETRQTFTAQEVTDAQSTFETQVEAMKLSISQMGMKLEYDSEHPEKTSPMLAGQTAEMEKELNKPVTVAYNALGELVGDPSELTSNQLGNVIINLPEGEISVGSTWTNEKTQSVSGIEFTVSTEYTVTAISKKSVDVSYKGTVTSDDVTGSTEGTASINPQTGIVMKTNGKQNISMTITEQGMSIPLTTAANVTITVEEK